MPVPATQRFRVLVIDDDPLIRELLCALLSTEEQTIESVDTAESGEAALVQLRITDPSTTPHVILTDMQLPGVSGAALAAELRRAAPHACLLGMSGSEPAAADRAAFDAFLLKPFTTEDFAVAVLAARRAGPPSQPAANASQAEAQPGTPPNPEPLDETTYARLAAALPATQLAELYQLTLDDIAQRLVLMRDAQTAGETAAFRREAHALKGGCSMVGARELAALAALAETGSSGDTPTPEEFSAAAERLRSIMAARAKAKSHNVKA